MIGDVICSYKWYKKNPKIKIGLRSIIFNLSVELTNLHSDQTFSGSQVSAMKILLVRR